MNTLSLNSSVNALSPNGGIQQYLNYARSIPQLSAEEERQLFVQFQQQNDLNAARKIILSHLRFVAHVARSYSGYGLPVEDIIQEGNIGLMKSVKRFDLSFGVRLSSFAMHWIKAEINDYVLKNWRLVKIATTKAKRKLFFNLRSMKKSLSWLTTAETKEIAEKLKVSEQDVADVESLLNAPDAYFDTTFGDSKEDDYQPGLTSAVALEDVSQAPHLLLEHKQNKEDGRDRLLDAIQGLDERSRDIIESRWLDASENKATLHDLAARYGVSAERIRQIEAAALKKLKSLMLE